MTLAVQVGQQICFGVQGSLNITDPGTDLRIGTPTYVTCTMDGIVAGAMRQSDKADLTQNRASAFEVMASVDFTGETITTPGTIDFYWAPSTSGTQGSGNVAGNSGVDATVPDGALGSITDDEFIAQCDYIGSLTLHDGASVQTGFVGVFSPSSRYGQLVVVNNCDSNLEAGSPANEENHVVFTPIALADV